MSDVTGSGGARNPLLILAAVAGVLVATLLGRARRVVVHGLSMTPTLLPGDRLLVLPARTLRIGDVVAVPDPRQPERLLVKRVVGVDRRTAAVTVAGDNPDASTDSATFGPVARQSVVGRAIYRYHPPERTGRIRRAPRAVNGARTTGEPPVTLACREAPVTHAGGTIPRMAATPLDDVLDPGFLEGITGLPVEEVRVRRTRASQVEVGLSYLRRLIQGRLDIVLDEAGRRDAGRQSSDLSALVQRLPEILGEHVHGPGSGRLPMLLAPPDAERNRTEQLDLILDAEQLATLPELDDAELESKLTALAVLEREVSADRRALHGVIDRLQRELVRRYKTGEATVEGLLL